MSVSLHVNVDHIATLRQARGSRYPDPVHGAVLCERAGADGITVHLREDRRHIQDRDVAMLRELVTTTLNLEMAATEEMLVIATRLKPDLVTLVPEKRQERTTEGGLDVAAGSERLGRCVDRLRGAGLAVSLFIDPEEEQVRASAELGAGAIELHTGDYANATGAEMRAELERLARAASLAATEFPGLRVAAGHGLTVRNVADLVASVTTIVELNIGHALVADAVFVGIEEAVGNFRRAIEAGERRR